MSQGNVIFHFQNKETLLEQTLIHLRDEYTHTWQLALEKSATDPVSRFRALLGASFSPQICNRRKISVWFAFWGESRSRPGLPCKVCGDSDQAFSDTLLELCRALETQHMVQT